MRAVKNVPLIAFWHRNARAVFALKRGKRE